MLWLVESFPQQRLTDERQGKGTAAVEVASREEAQILEGVVGKQVGFIDEEDGAFGQAPQMGDEPCGGIPLEARGSQPAERSEM